MPQVEIRPARSEDREAVLAFCVETWKWGDYIEGLLRPKLKVSEDDLDRVHLD